MPACPEEHPAYPPIRESQLYWKMPGFNFITVRLTLAPVSQRRTARVVASCLPTGRALVLDSQLGRPGSPRYPRRFLQLTDWDLPSPIGDFHKVHKNTQPVCCCPLAIHRCFLRLDSALTY
uniref:Uncharacterized protein n=1 Tax=Trypanosoma congolense (strain IL3000) TaxID=1068625 RepID=F9WE27_TRYCI|nr:hypothetical protein, unlikely [Trypanosoma congolense IL3000]